MEWGWDYVEFFSAVCWQGWFKALLRMPNTVHVFLDRGSWWGSDMLLDPCPGTIVASGEVETVKEEILFGGE